VPTLICNKNDASSLKHPTEVCISELTNYGRDEWINGWMESWMSGRRLISFGQVYTMLYR
jgi:hypothetical protein